MIKLQGTCDVVHLQEEGVKRQALRLTIVSEGDEPVPLNGVYLCRKGINVMPEFAAGWGLDTSHIVPGLPPERYQFRVALLGITGNGEIFRGDETSEAAFPPGMRCQFVLPMPFMGIPYFTEAPEEDVFFVMTNLSATPHVIEARGFQKLLQESLTGPQPATLPHADYKIIVPYSKPLTDEERRATGTFNPFPIKPMPNT